MNILVTGSNGQLGSEIRKLAPNFGNTFLFTDVAELDITDIEAVRNCVVDNNIDVIINCAAYTNVDRAEDDYDNALLINGTAVSNLATVCSEHNAKLIHISTDYVFQGNGCVPCTEEMDVNPLGVYGKTKLYGEQAVIQSGCYYMIFRTSWLYSEYGNNFVKTIRRLSGERDSLNVVFDQVGTPTYAADLAKLICKVVEDADFCSEKSGIYHFANEGVCSWYDFALEIVEMSGNQCAVLPCHSDEFPSKVKRPHYSVLDKSKVKKVFNVVIPHWKEALKRCILRLEG
ncbi:MAG: dTDP-4-dehydrorhamnose reductase [Marinifilaceae bacterium]|nr:dTDP-4-dehydrorhamnose reductase [Marinifilaceae bacterium]